MLTPADAALVHRDPALPGLAAVLDPEVVLDRSGPAEHGPRAVNAEATYVRYKPGTSCVVGYRLATDAGPVLAYAKAFHPGDNAKLGKAREKEAPNPVVGWGVFTDHTDTVLVATASSDRDLPALAALTDADRRKALLRRLVGGDPDLWHVEPRPMRHKPERRWLGLVERDGAPVALLKAYRVDDVNAARAGQELLAVPAVPPLGWSRRFAVLASTWVPGPPLSDALTTTAPVDAALVGAALAQLHALPPSRRLPRIDDRHTIGAVVEAAEAVAVLNPELRSRACRLADRISSALRALPPLTTVVHGDFSADQVILTEPAVTIIDFDRAAVADPAADLGSFAADLDRSELAGRLAPGRAAAITAEMIGGHRHAGGPPTGDRVVVHQAAALLRLATAPFRERLPDWPTATGTIFRRAEAVAAELP